MPSLSVSEIAWVVAVALLVGFAIMVILGLTVRPAPLEESVVDPVPEPLPPSPAAPAPLRLESLEAAGFELLDLYDDVVSLEAAGLAGTVSSVGRERHEVVRTAKVRHLPSGRIELIQVLSALPPSR